MWYRSLGGTLLVVVVLAGPASAQVDLGIPTDFRISEATFVVGHVSFGDDAGLRDPVVAGPRSAAATGTLTVCPNIFTSEGVVRPVVLQGLAATSSECDGAQTFQNPKLEFGAGTRLAFGGLLGVSQMPGAAMVAPFANSTVAITLGSARTPMLLAPEGGPAAFGSTTAASSVVVMNAQEPAYFNGTGYAYFLDTSELSFHADAIASPFEGRFQVLIVPAARDDVDDALARPFSLLDAEETLFGANTREPRGNVSGVLREFGRIPAYVNGALLGRLNGTAFGNGYEGSVALVRGDRFDLELDGARLEGTGQPRVAVSPAGVAFEEDEPRNAPWIFAIILWVVAAVVLLVRRRAPTRTLWLSLGWTAAVILTGILFDRMVLEDDFGAGFFSEAGHADGIGTVLALATFDVVLVAASFVTLALPGRLLLGRVVPQRFLWIGEAVWCVVWAVLPLLFPAHFFALGYTFARL